MIMMHAENGTAIDVLVAQALARGETAPRYHGAHPAVGDRRRRRRTGRSCSRTSPARPLYVVHMSAKQAVSTLARGPRRGLERLRRDLPAVPLPLARGAARRSRASRARSGCAPRRCEPRRRATRTSCGATCAPATSSVVSTDHCPFCFKEQKELGRRRLLQDPQRDRRRRAPHGPALPGRRRRDASRSSRWVEMCCTTPARMFGLHPRKGEIAARAPTPTSSSTTRSARTRISVDDAPHEHGPLGVGGLRDRRRRRHRALARTGRGRGRARSSAARATGSSCAAACRSTSSDRHDLGGPHGLRRRAAVQPAGLAGGRPGEEGRARGLLPTCGRSTRTCSGRSRTSSTARSWRRPTA